MKYQALHSNSDGKNLRTVPDDELLSRLGELVSQSRCVEAELVAHIGEVDERRLFARFAFSSMFAYCTQALHLSEAEAYRRITVARAARQFEELLEMLRDGRMHLTGMALIVPLLTPENRQMVLARATHRSKREIEELVAELSPQRDVPSLMRKLPQKRTVATLPGGPSTSIATGGLFPGTVDNAAPAAPATTDGATPPEGFSGHGRGVGGGLELFPGRVDAPAAVVEPLSPARYKVQFTASQQLRDKLERLTALMHSEVPDGDLAAIIDRAISEKLERLEARRLGKTAAPRKSLEDTGTSSSRYIPVAVRRAVCERDGNRCCFVDEQSRRCSERRWLEFHHRRPFGLGGDHSPDNICLMCPRHNQYLAEADYGPAVIQPHRRTGTQGSVELGRFSMCR
jgi:hypothetical protein